MEKIVTNTKTNFKINDFILYSYLGEKWFGTVSDVLENDQYEIALQITNERTNVTTTDYIIVSGKDLSYPKIIKIKNAGVKMMA